MSPRNVLTEYNLPRICLNGHIVGFDFVSIVNKSLNHRGYPFCEVCGQAAITKCPACKSDIARRPLTTWMASDADTDAFKAPNFCRRCGEPYPWTQRRLQTAKELIEHEEALAAEEKLVFEADINDITRDAPRTQAAAIRIKGFLGKIPGAVGSALRDILVDVAGEAAKKIILGP